MVDLTVEERQLLANNPEISIAIALDDHNFSDLKEFTIGQISTTSADVEMDTTADEPHPLLHSSSQEIASSCPSMSVEPSVAPMHSSPSPLSSLHSAMQSFTPESASEEFPVDSDNVSNFSGLGDSHPIAADRERAMSVESGSMKSSKSGGLLGWLSAKRKEAGIGLSDTGGASDTVSMRSSQLTGKKKKMRLADWSSESAAVGISRSATASRNLREQVKKGEFTPKAANLARWKKKLVELDANCLPDEKTAKRVRHSACGRWIVVKDVYDTVRFKDHINKQCNKRPPTATAQMPEVSQWESKFNITLGEQPKQSNARPCPGLTERDDGRIPIYLGRTSAIGGGARSITRIALERFKKFYRKLSKTRKKEVLDVQMHEHRWVNDHFNERVFSHSCLKSVSGIDSFGDRVHPCSSCGFLLGDAQFKRALNKPPPKDRNIKYINKRWLPSDKLISLYARVVGLKEIIEESVSSELSHWSRITDRSLGSKKYTMYQICSGCARWKVQRSQSLHWSCRSYGYGERP